MTAAADAQIDDWDKQVVDHYFGVLRAADGSGPPPHGIPPIALRRARKMLSVLGDGVGSLEISAPDGSHSSQNIPLNPRRICHRDSDGSTKITPNSKERLKLPQFIMRSSATFTTLFPIERPPALCRAN